MRRSFSRPLALAASVLVSASFAGLAAAQQSGINLPEMGDPADQVMSPRQERALGEAFMRQVMATMPLVDDALLNDYISELGDQIAVASGKRDTDFTFFIVASPVINAFAAPGGFIGVNSGLLLEAEKESELAGVMAHEVAHVTQRHIARAYAKTQNTGLTTAAAILAAILLGSQNPQAGQAALTTGIAATQQMQLNYTRANEYEADRIGIGILANAGLDPSGMVDFFETLERQNSTAGFSIPEFLSTHPLSIARIGEARNRADALRRPGQRTDSDTYQLVRMRLRVLTHPVKPTLLREIAAHADSATGVNRSILLYGKALTEYELALYEDAAATLDMLPSSARENLFVALLLAENLYARGDLEGGRTVFEQLASIYADDVPVLLAYGNALYRSGEYQRAITLYRKSLRQEGLHRASTYRQLARVADAAGDTIVSLQALAEYYILNNQENLALSQLERALSMAEEGSSTALRIEARLETVRDELAERIRQRGG